MIFILNGTVFPRTDDVGPEGDTATLPADVFLGDNSIQDYIDMARAAGIGPAQFVITTSNLSEGADLEIASDQYIKGLEAQDPFAQGIAEGVCAIKSFLGEECPPFIAIPGYAVTKDNLLEAYELIL